MRLALSTLGVPGMPVADAARLAADGGFHGLELRAHPQEPVHTGLPPGERADTVAICRDAGVEILAVAGGVRVAQPGEDEQVLEEAAALLELARDLGAPCARVFPGAAADAGRDTSADTLAVRRLCAVARIAADTGVRVLLETHDSHARGADVARVLEGVRRREVGAVWDVMHTWRAGEDPADTFAHLAPYLGHVQVKDIASRDDIAPLPPGSGVLPLADTTDLLMRADWDGWLCWEYEKRWYPQAPALSSVLDAGREHLLRLLSAAA
ncbi:sugar phosphate isomerase/epimerase family protein [Streptomyces sp. TR06-5]|uniref:sugar phosphate isomerase/epimerase family protein n=1 Tax=Streptomyces sp. TR06-5 TaxID=3385976 RepID=UPI00399EEC15